MEGRKIMKLNSRTFKTESNPQSLQLRNIEIISQEHIEKKNTEIALLNILEDYNEEKSKYTDIQNSLLNILDDYNIEKTNLENTQRAVLNILDDYSKEKINLENSQRAVLNILDDYTIEIEKIEKINKELNFSNNELEQFFYVTSHHLQEPLRLITSFLQLLEKKYKDKLDQDATDYIQFAVDGSIRMKALILGLLDYSQVNKINVFEEIELNDLITKVIENLKVQIDSNNAQIKIDHLPKIIGDKIQISQLFENLISNAIKFRGENRPEIFITGNKEGDQYIFSVKDNGIGIQKEYANKLFSIFQRLNTNVQIQGTGIGLAICKKIVEKHGGKIWFESEFGKGSTFYFTIKETQKILK